MLKLSISNISSTLLFTSIFIVTFLIKIGFGNNSSQDEVENISYLENENLLSEVSLSLEGRHGSRS